MESIEQPCEFGEGLPGEAPASRTDWELERLVDEPDSSPELVSIFGREDRCWSRSTPSPLGATADDCDHEWRRTGAAQPATDCESPQCLTCLLCSATCQVRCGAAQVDRCGPCGERHRVLIARVCREGMRRNMLGLFFCTLTAPGKEVLPFDPGVCTHGAGVRCDGTKGCRVDRVAAAVWNGRMPQNWSWLVTELRRELGDVQYFKAVETHQRGVLHVHFVCSVPGGASSDHVRAVLRRLAVKWSFGHVLDVQRITPAKHEGIRESMEAWVQDGDGESEFELEVARKAGYLAKYSTKGGKRAECLTRDGEISNTKGYRVWSASARFGPRMQELRLRQRAHWFERADDVACDGVGVATLDLNTDIYTGDREEPWWEEEEGGWGEEDM